MEAMEVVINVCFGGFGLSDAAIERCIELGMTVGSQAEINNRGKQDFFRWDKPQFGQMYAEADCSRKEFRADPRVVQAVRELGEAANGPCAKLKIVDIPFDGPEGWSIDEYDGFEKIDEDHRTWS